MSPVNVHMTYMGSCSLAGNNVLCTSMSASLEQKVQFYDHIVGVQDKINSGSAGSATTKGPSPTAAGGGGSVLVQKKTYRYTPALAKARMECPIMGDNSGSDEFKDILNKAISGEDVEAVLTFWKSGASKISVKKAKITTFTLSLKAGDVATFSCELVGAEYKSETGSSSPIDCTKLVTWDKCSVSGDVSAQISSLDLTISNPPVPIYTAQWSDANDASGGLMPQKIRLGVQEVSGTLSLLENVSLSGPGELKFNVNGIQKTIKVVFLPPTDQANSGQYIQTINFVGANDGVVWS